MVDYRYKIIKEHRIDNPQVLRLNPATDNLMPVYVVILEFKNELRSVLVDADAWEQDKERCIEILLNNYWDYRIGFCPKKRRKIKNV